MNELIWHVDEYDSPIGSIDRGKSRQIGAIYRMARVSVETNDGKILIQKRQPTKKSYPNCWDTAVGGNVDYGESYEDAAKRESAEEIGLVGADLEEVAYYYGEVVDPSGKKMNRFTRLYRAIVDESMQFSPQPEEVSEVRWVVKSELFDLVGREGATDGLAQAIEQYYQKPPIQRDGL